MSIRIVIAEDQDLIRRSLRVLLEQTPDFAVVGEAGNGREAVAKAHALKPDVVLMDIGMPELNGIEATARILAEVPGTRVVMLSSHDDQGVVLRAVRSGARGYVLKTATADELAAAVRAVARGEVHFGPAVAEHLVLLAASPGAAADPLDRLSPRQREILQLIAEGRSTKEIAFDLGLSPSTVDTHRTELMRRLGIHDVAGLVRFAYAAGLLKVG
jgi:DNA-binding NarL/FixJ family response regulator